MYALAFNGENGAVLNFADANKLVLMIKSSDLTEDNRMRIFVQTLLMCSDQVEPNPLQPTDAEAYRVRMDAWFNNAFPLLWRHAADAQITLSKAIAENQKQIEAMKEEMEKMKNQAGKWSGPYNNGFRNYNSNQYNNNGGKHSNKNNYNKNNNHSNNSKGGGKNDKNGKKGKKQSLPKSCFDWMWGLCEKENCPHEHKRPSREQFEQMQSSKLSWAVAGLSYDDLPES
ncbi:unnamed protein product [Amoebophrya sp. A25]|nr:unnamed protein product [Amoebophrya sp. A25]|eukprot:GSA25T00019040001.1